MSQSEITSPFNMSAWRREALKRLPEGRQVIEAAENPMELWIRIAEEMPGRLQQTRG